MQSDVPKQYLTLHGRTVLEHSLARVTADPRIDGVVLALATGDPYWAELELDLAVGLVTTEGGAERCHSVLACLEVLREQADNDDWVLVHDAARPCLRRTDLERLLAELEHEPVGGLLAVPVNETLKRASGARRVQGTVDRTAMWRAQTPQMFRLGLLYDALQAAVAAGQIVTDEAQAVELAGLSPILVEGHDDNIKVTVPEDRFLAELYLKRAAE
jgi:2-C-methyl-D-erythritol 4-phosphate cytidylyltransferase